MKKTAIAAGLLLSVSMMVSALAQYEMPIDTPENFVTATAKYGRIKVVDVDGKRQLCDEKGNPIQLRGMSSFGLQWEDGDWILTDDVFDTLAFDWNIDVIRLAMYVGEDGYADNPAELLAKVEKGINLANRRGLYVIVDWHVLNPGDPTDPKYLTAGLDLPQYANIRRYHPEFTGPQLFFAYLSDKYGNLPNIIWEIANEPNQIEADDPWGDVILPYSQGVVEVIRQYDRDGLRDNIVIVGTNNWSQFVDEPISAPVQDPNGQIMYAVHFYAGTHDSGHGDEESRWLRDKITAALDGGLAVFCSEWGTSLASGDEGPFIDFSERWLNFLDENKISWTSWSLARKAEVSSSTLPNTSDHPVDSDEDGIKNWDWNEELSVTGRFVRAKIRGDAIPLYTAEDGSQNNGDINPVSILAEESPEEEVPVEESPEEEVFEETIVEESPEEEVSAEEALEESPEEVFEDG
jgi:endoglucanase